MSVSQISAVPSLESTSMAAKLEFVRRQPEVNVIAFRSQRSRFLAISVTPSQAADMHAGADIGQSPRGAGGKGGVRMASASYPLAHSERLAGEFETLGIKRLCQQRIAFGIKKIPGGCVRDAGIGREKPFLGLSIQRADIDPAIFRQAAANEIDEMKAIGQELRPA